MKEDSPKLPSPVISLIPLTILVILLFITIRLFGSDALGGGSQVVLLTGAGIATAIAMIVYKIKWKQIEKAIINNIAGVGTAIIILLIIGALSGSWMVSGVIPALIYYGLKIINPDFFLVSTCVICAIISVMTGSSWTTIATIGIALLGIGQAQGYSEGWIAGAIISGAYFGDKVSPLSDTTILAASASDVPVFTHIQYLMGTTIPSVIISLVIFTIAGFTHQAIPSEHIAEYSFALKETFHISLWLLLVPVITGMMIARKFPSLITLFLSATLAAVFALFFQPHLLLEISGLDIQGATSGFKGLLITLFGSTEIQTGNTGLNELVSTRGMGGMMDTIWLIICAMCFGGAMTGSGMLQSITSLFIRFMKKTVSLVASTVASGILLNITTADQYISIILSGNMFRDIYKEKGYENRLLSRSIEDGVTVTSPLVSWSTCGLTQATILGVATFTYLPYCFFNILSPFMSIIIAATGYKIYRTNEKDKDLPTG